MNKVSIITPSYNCAGFIGETIESVQAQTYTNWNMIIVDDCSTDNTEEVVKKYIRNDNRIIFHRLSENYGAAVSRTKAMEIADGDFMAFLDSDDLWDPEKLELQLRFMIENNYSMTATAYRQISEDGSNVIKTVISPQKVDYERILLDCPVGNSTIMYNVNKMGRFTVPDIRKRNDDALWLKMLKVEEYIQCMDKVLMSYRIRQNSISSNKLALVKYHWVLYRKIEHLSILKSVFLICHWGVIKIFRIK